MSKNNAKFAIFVVGLMISLIAGGIGLWGVAQFVVAFQQGADPASIFHGATLIVPQEKQARWLPDSPSTGTSPSDGQREELIAAYWQAWQGLDRAQQTGDVSDLATYWAGNAFKEIQIDPKRHFQQTDLGHKLTLTFFSDDGTV